MRIRRSLTSRATALGFVVLFLATATLAQDKPAIERMNDRVAEWQKAPANRFVGFEVAFPATPEEAALVANNAMLLITTASVVRDEAFSSSVFILADGKQFSLTALGSSAIAAHPEGFYRSDKVLLLPLKWVTAGAQVKVTSGSHFLKRYHLAICPNQG